MLSPGLYERLLDEELNGLVERLVADGFAVDLKQLADFAPEDPPLLLSRHVAEKVRQILPELGDRKTPAEAADVMAATANRLLELVRARGLMLPPRMLLEVRRPGASIMPTIRPADPLSHSALFTGARSDPSLESQIIAELASTDRLDILVSFIKHSGLVLILPQLEEFVSRGGAIRAITTSYMGASDSKAVERLAKLPNTQLRVSYDTENTRLHAKAWMFWRNSGYSTALVGSSNLTRPAMTQGLEWNLRVSAIESPAVFDKFHKTFETYWVDDEFEQFDPACEVDCKRLSQALDNERSNEQIAPLRFFVDITPHPFQQQILDELDAARQVRGEWRNLVVAATGTGKTIIAAFDYKRLVERTSMGGGRLLYIAHRREILQAACDCFRTVMRDANLGELVFDGRRSHLNRQVFAAVQSLSGSGLLDLPPDQFDMIIVDEAHHIAASSYRPALMHFQPRILLGLTATPERMDGERIEPDFGGRITSELRLPDAVERKHLCPFHYHCITDNVDYSNIEFRGGQYDVQQLQKVLTGNDLRVDLIIKALDRYLANPRRVRALGFCVSIRHAQFMADCFDRAGLKSIALTTKSSARDRSEAPMRMLRGEIAYIFTVDLYNEGVDIPSIDTVLFLRPTESLTVFLQQLGRGLRHWKQGEREKECLTVLDFVGHAHRQFRYGDRFRALVGRTHHAIEKELEAGFPHLPSGCFIQMERIAREHILENIRQNTVAAQKPSLVKAIRNFDQVTEQHLTLANFIDFHQLDLESIYWNGKRCWSTLCREAEITYALRPGSSLDPEHAMLVAALRRLLHHDSPQLLQFIQRWCDLSVQSQQLLGTESDRGHALMLHYAIWEKSGPELGMASLADSRARLLRNPQFCAELRELAALLFSRVKHMPPQLPAGTLPSQLLPLQLHCQYRSEEILAALGHWTWDRAPDMREGVLHLKEQKLDAFLFTVNKPEKAFKESTRYDDYGMSSTLFHWQSQNRTSIKSPTGQRYIHHAALGNTVLLFARIEQEASDKRAEPFLFLGPATYVSHEGDRPISIVWRLHVPMPPEFLMEAGKLTVAL